MNMHHLRSFLLIAEKKSFSSAAQDMFISVQAIRQQIGLLEKEIGVPLFVRNTKGVSLTAEGSIFYEKAEQLLELHDTCLEEVRDFADKQKQLHISMYVNPILPAITDICSEFSKQYPTIEQHIVPSGQPVGSIFSDLSKGIVDIFLYPKTKHNMSNIGFTELYSNRAVCLVSPSHHLSESQALDIRDLQNEKIMCYNKKVYPDLFEYISENHIDVFISEYLSSSEHNKANLEISGIISHCLAGSIFFVPEEYSRFFSTLNKIPLVPAVPWVFGLYHKKQASLEARLFIEVAKATFNKNSSPY